MIWLLRLLQSVAKPSATDRLLITLVKSPAVALLQRFRRVLAAYYHSEEHHGDPGVVRSEPGQVITMIMSGDHPRKIVQQRNTGRFHANYQYLGCCTRVCNRLQQPQQGTDQCARR
jgi:hypothetical protein